jgi:HlyD family secretion protein
LLLLGLPVLIVGAAFAWNAAGWFVAGHRKSGLACEFVKRGPLEVKLTERGNVDSGNNLTLRSLVEGGTGTVILKIVDEGTQVEPGQVLVELDSARLREEELAQRVRVDSALAAFKTAEADIAIQRLQNESDVAAAKLKLELARLDLQKYKNGDYVQQTQIILGEVQLAAEYLTRASERWRFSERLLRKGFTTTKVLDADRVALARARIDLDAAREKRRVLDRYEHRRELAELESNTVFCEQELERVKLRGQAAMSGRERIVLSRKRSYFLENERHKKLVEQVAACTIRSPREGMVVYANTLEGGRSSSTPLIYEGATVRERQAMIHLPDLTRMQVNARVHETKVMMLSEGQDVAVHVDACGEETFHGVVGRVAMVPNSGSWPNFNVKEYTTTIDLTDELEKLAELRPGMTAEVEILVDRVDSVLQTPIQSCVERGGRYFAWVQEDDDDIERHEIQLGRTNDVAAEIVAGLTEGDRVVLNPRSTLPDEVALLEQEFTAINEAAVPKHRDAPHSAHARETDSDRELVPARGAEKPTGRPADGEARPHEIEKPPASPGLREPATVLILASLPDAGENGGKSGSDPLTVFDRLDRNHDAKVSESELPDPMKGVMPRLDTNGDHVIDKDEWKKGTCTVPSPSETKTGTDSP